MKEHKAPILVWTLCLLVFFIGLLFSFDAFGRNVEGHTAWIAGERGLITGVLCDTQAQVERVGNAWVKDSIPAAKAELAALVKTPSIHGNGEPSCALGNPRTAWTGMALERVGDSLGEVTWIDGSTVPLYVVRVFIANDQKIYFVLSTMDVVLPKKPGQRV